MCVYAYLCVHVCVIGCTCASMQKLEDSGQEPVPTLLLRQLSLSLLPCWVESVVWLILLFPPHIST